jgi:hypothetical protein
MKHEQPEDDLEIRPADGEEAEAAGPLLPVAERRGPGPVLWATLAVLLLAALFGLVWFLRPAPPPTPSVSPAAPAAAAAASPSPTPLVLPPLDGSDAVVRQIAAGLSRHPLLASWLAQNDLVRLMAAVVVNVAEGESPRAHLGLLDPKRALAVKEGRGERIVIDPASYTRYDTLGDAFESLDAAAAARAYQALEPLFEAAYRELGHPEGGFSRVLDQALANLIAVPVVEGEVPVIRVRKAVFVYEYVDERLEALSIPQKHLLRMGPRNVTRIRAKLQDFAKALRPAETSPASPS